MSGIYPSYKSRLIDWATEANPPAGVQFSCTLVNASFSFDAADVSLSDVAGNYESIGLDNVTYVGGRLRADDLSLTGLEIEDFIHGILVYLEWAGGSQLVCFINEATGLTFPFLLASPTFEIAWNPEGIIQL